MLLQTTPGTTHQWHSLADCVLAGEPITAEDALQGKNIVESGLPADPSVVIIADPQLGPLADNGGPTQTHLPQAGSPAIDAGDNAEASGLTTDQRGFDRISNSTVDIGAVEVGAGDITYSIALDPPSINEGSSGDETTATVTVTRSGAASDGSSVDVALDGTATEGDDYTVALASDSAGSFDATTLSFAANKTEATLTITVQGDDVVEGDETVEVTLANPTAPEGATITPPNTVTLTITDDDTAGVTVTPTEVTVSESGTTDTYTVVLDSQPTADVEVSVTSSDTGEATASPTTLTFTTANWNTPQTVTVSAVDDSEEEGNHTGTISHSAASSDSAYNGISIADVTVTVQDNDSSNTGQDLMVYLPLIAR